MPAPFGLGERRRLAGTTSRHPLQHIFTRQTSDATPPRYIDPRNTAIMPCAAFVWVERVTGK